MTVKGKTFKDTKEGKEEAAFFKGRKEGKPKPPKGGHRNLLAEQEEEDRKELEEEMKILQDYDDAIEADLALGEKLLDSF